nr:immune associated protein 38 [Mus musculus]CAB53101.1 immunity assocated protein 38 [Mus musculus]
MQKGETGKNLSSENPKQMGAPGFQGEQAMWVLPLYAEGLNTSLSQRKACVSDSMLPHLILRLRGLQGPADAPAEAHPSGQDWDRQECHWQQHPGSEVLPVQAGGGACHQKLHFGQQNVGRLAGGGGGHPGYLQLRDPADRPWVRGDSPLLCAVGPWAARAAAGHPAGSLHHAGQPGAGRGEAVIREAGDGAHCRGVHAPRGPGWRLPAGLCALHGQPRAAGPGGRVRGPRVRPQQPRHRQRARGSG